MLQACLCCFAVSRILYRSAENRVDVRVLLFQDHRFAGLIGKTVLGGAGTGHLSGGLVDHLIGNNQTYPSKLRNDDVYLYLVVKTAGTMITAFDPNHRGKQAACLHRGEAGARRSRFYEHGVLRWTAMGILAGYVSPGYR